MTVAVIRKRGNKKKMVSFCEECHSEMITCQSCGRSICTNGCNGNWEHVETPVAHGNYCTRCLSGQTEIHAKLRDYSQKMGSKAMILRAPKIYEFPDLLNEERERAAAREE